MSFLAPYLTQPAFLSLSGRAYKVSVEGPTEDVPASPTWMQLFPARSSSAGMWFRQEDSSPSLSQGSSPKTDLRHLPKQQPTTSCASQGSDSHTHPMPPWGDAHRPGTLQGLGVPPPLKISHLVLASPLLTGPQAAMGTESRPAPLGARDSALQGSACREPQSQGTELQSARGHPKSGGGLH